jgi:hypothetical protein
MREQILVVRIRIRARPKRMYSNNRTCNADCHNSNSYCYNLNSQNMIYACNSAAFIDFLHMRYRFDVHTRKIARSQAMREVTFAARRISNDTLAKRFTLCGQVALAVRCASLAAASSILARTWRAACAAGSGKDTMSRAGCSSRETTFDDDSVIRFCDMSVANADRIIRRVASELKILGSTLTLRVE